MECEHDAPPGRASARRPRRAQGSWWLFGFQITTPFVGGVGLVILSIFIYGAKVEQLAGWMSTLKSAVGLGRTAQYAPVAMMEPLNGEDEEEAAAPPSATDTDGATAAAAPGSSPHRA